MSVVLVSVVLKSALNWLGCATAGVTVTAITMWLLLRLCPVRSLAAFDKSEHPDDWRDLMRLYLIRRTRSFIKDNYAKTDPSNQRKFLTFESGVHSVHHAAAANPSHCAVASAVAHLSGDVAATLDALPAPAAQRRSGAHPDDRASVVRPLRPDSGRAPPPLA